MQLPGVEKEKNLSSRRSGHHHGLNPRKNNLGFTKFMTWKSWKQPGIFF